MTKRGVRYTGTTKRGWRCYTPAANWEVKLCSPRAADSSLLPTALYHFAVIDHAMALLKAQNR